MFSRVPSEAPPRGAVHSFGVFFSDEESDDTENEEVTIEDYEVLQPQRLRDVSLRAEAQSRRAERDASGELQVLS